MSKEELDIVQMTLIARIQEEIDALMKIKYSINKKKAIDERLAECDKELKLLMEAGDDNY